MKKNALLIGSAESQIEIKLPAMLNGHINRNKPAEGFIDHPEIHLIVLKDDYGELVVVSIDVLEIETSVCSLIRQRISGIVGVSEKSVMISCTHAHTVPAAIRLGLVEMDEEFVKTLSDQVCGLALKAAHSLVPCCMMASKGNCIGIGINRRKEICGQILMAPNPDGPNDTSVLTYWFFSKTSKLIACLVNFNMHATTLDVTVFEVSADYPQYMRRKINEQFPSANILFFNGACGDIRPNLIQDDGSFRGGFESDLVRIGCELGQSVIDSLKNASLEKETCLQAISKTIELKYSYQDDKRPRRIIDKNSSEGRQIDQGLMAQAFEKWEQERVSSRIKPVSVGFEIQGFSLSTRTSIVALPAEVFVQTGMEIRENSPFVYTIVSGYSNGSVGYIPNEESIKQGGYEAQDAYKLYYLPAPFVPETAHEIIDGTESALNQLCMFK